MEFARASTATLVLSSSTPGFALPWYAPRAHSTASITIQDLHSTLDEDPVFPHGTTERNSRPSQLVVSEGGRTADGDKNAAFGAGKATWSFHPATDDDSCVDEGPAETTTSGQASGATPSFSVSTAGVLQSPTPSSQGSSSSYASPATAETSEASSVQVALASCEADPTVKQQLASSPPRAPPKQYSPYIRPPPPPTFTDCNSSADLASATARPRRVAGADQSIPFYTTPLDFDAGSYPYSNTSLLQDYGNAFDHPTSIFHFACFPATALHISSDRPRMASDLNEEDVDLTYGFQTTPEEMDRAKVLAAEEEERMVRIEARVLARRQRNLALNPQPIKTVPAAAVVDAAPRVSRIVKPTAKAQALMKAPSRQSRLPQPRPLKNPAMYSRFKRTLAVSLFPDHIHRDRKFDFSGIPGVLDLLSLPSEYIADNNLQSPPTATAPESADTLRVDIDLTTNPSPSMPTAPLMSKSTSASASTSVFDSPAPNRLLDIIASPRIGSVTNESLGGVDSPAIKSNRTMSAVGSPEAQAKRVEQDDILVAPASASTAPQQAVTQGQIPNWIHDLNSAPGLDDWAASTTIDEQYAMEPAQPPQPQHLPFQQQPADVPRSSTSTSSLPTTAPKPIPSPAAIPSCSATPLNDLGLSNITPTHDPSFRNAEASTSALPAPQANSASPAPTTSTTKAGKVKKPRAAPVKRARATDDDVGKRRKKPKEAPGILVKADDDLDTPSGFYTLQSTTCLSKRCDGAVKCFECIARTVGHGCCFEGIRSFGADSEGSIIEPGKIRNTTETDDLPYFGRPLNALYTPQHGEWIRSAVAPHLIAILERELAHSSNAGTKRIRNDVKKVHTCDTCLHSSLVGDWLCSACGRSSCHQCRAELMEISRKEHEGGATGAAVVAASQTVEQQRRKKCVTKKRGVTNGAECHTAESFTPLTWVDKDSLRAQLEAAKAWSLAYPVQKAVEVVPIADFDRFYPPLPSVASERNVRCIPVAELTEGFFHQLWEKPEPIVIDQISLASIGAWTPQHLASQFVDVPCELVNNKSQETAPSLLSYFFDMYGREKPDPRSWKLKKFPVNGFEQLPEMRSAYLETIPLGDLLRPDGVLNLLAHAPSNTAQPETGPRSHFSWAGRGTRMLHMEVTDVMNLMTWSSRTAMDVPGSARYDVYLPHEAEVVRTFIFEQSAKKMHKGLSAAKYRETHDDPLLAENVFLDPNLRRELFDRHGIQSCTIWQKPGQFVMIPAGCPYQVTNYDDCLNIAHSFMSRESLARGLEVYAHSRLQTKERSLWRADTVQLERQLWFSWHSVDDLETPAPEPAPAPVKRARKTIKVDDVDWEP